MARGRLVVLRELGAGDAALLERWSAPGFFGEFSDLGPPDEEFYSSGVPIARLLVARSADDEPVGLVSWVRVWHGPNPGSRAWNIGISLVEPARGLGYGSEAQRLLAEHLLATTRVNRIEASTDVENGAEQRALEKAGFVREGILRGAQFRAGRWRDLVGYSRLRSDGAGRHGRVAR